MLELLIAAFIQISVLTSGSAPTTTTTSTSEPAVKASAAPTVTTNIGTSGWDDRN